MQTRHALLELRHRQRRGGLGGGGGRGGNGGGGGGKTEVFDTSKVIFVLISDIGKDEMFELILDNDGRENTPPTQ